MAEVSGDGAVLVPPGAVTDLADALEAQLSGGDQVDARRRQGLDLAARYTWESCAQSHVDAYRWAAAAWKNPGRGTEGGDR
jgi:glycosyltransferase involved in cell wall biosynthesis